MEVTVILFVVILNITRFTNREINLYLCLFIIDCHIGATSLLIQVDLSSTNIDEEIDK